MALRQTARLVAPFEVGALRTVIFQYHRIVTQAPAYTNGIKVPIGQAAAVTLPPRIFCGRLYGVLFDTNKSFLRPSALQGMKGLKRYYDEKPGLSVLVCGHADRSGDEAYNLTLSQERADAIASYLQDKVDDWLAWYGSGKPAPKRWGANEDAQMLGFLGHEGGTAIADFQAAEGLADSGGKMNDETRRALVTKYMAEDDTTLPAGTTIETLGLGEYHPEVPTADGQENEENRRVEIFLFEGAIDPPAVRPVEKPGSKEYPIWRARTVDNRDLRDTSGEAVFLMVKDGKPQQGLRLLIRHPNGQEIEHETDDKGEVRCVGFAGEIFHLLCVLEGETCVAMSSFDVASHPA
jgi:outer membrane protein OmpA-like peptidoglycan-associated protein